MLQMGARALLLALLQYVLGWAGGHTYRQPRDAGS